MKRGPLLIGKQRIPRPRHPAVAQPLLLWPTAEPQRAREFALNNISAAVSEKCVSAYNKNWLLLYKNLSISAHWVCNLFEMSYACVWVFSAPKARP